MKSSKENYRSRFRNCEQKFREKLFLASYDLISLNWTSAILIQFYYLIDFLFLAAYPLQQIFTKSKSALNSYGYSAQQQLSSFVKYLNPANVVYDGFPSATNQNVMLILIVYLFVMVFFITAYVLSRNNKKIAASNNYKIAAKSLGIAILVNNFLLFVPIISFLIRMFTCDQGQSNCFQGQHLALVGFSGLSLFVSVLLQFYTLALMTTCYPNEQIPWAHFPSKVPYMSILFKMAIVLTYQLDQAGVVVMYFNAVFFLVQIFFLYRRLITSLTFSQAIHFFNLLSQSILAYLFLMAFFADLIVTAINTIYTVVLFLSMLAVGYCILMVKIRCREAFLRKIDVFNYRYEFDALHMMIALHELIEMSAFSEREDFILRGFIERHIEICDFPECNCMEYYKIINSSYRIQLATIATMKEDEANKGSINTTVNRATYEEDTTHDDNSMQKTFFVQNKSMVKQNKARTKFLNNFLINNIKVFLELFPTSVRLRYMSAFIYFSMFKNSFKALYELSFTKTLKSSFLESYNSYTLGLQIINYFQSRVNSFLSKENKILDLEIDLKSIIEFEKLNIKYQKSIEKTSEVAEAFWLEMNKKNISVDNIFHLGSNINTQFYQIKKKYKKLMSINSNYLEVAYLYKLFVSLCLNYELEETEAKMEITKILQAKGMRKKNLRQEYCRINFSDENGMIIISGCQKDFSKILAMNNKAERIFGYNTDELINHALAKLAPIAYGYTHDDFILNYINSKRKINKEAHNFVWGKHKSGFIMPLVMDISPYVTFDYNLCFIAFCKRSILLEMYPLKEILDAQDVFVLLADQKGVITDMTRNITEWLGFPLQALNKDISLEQIFDGVLEDECEKDFQEGKKIDFFMNSFKDALDDFENRSEDEFESTLCMKEKKCRALVWMKIHEHQLTQSTYQAMPQGIVTGSSGQIGTLGGSVVNPTQNHPQSYLIVREIWFVLLEEEAATATATASFLDTNKTDSGLDKEELKFTYQEDREEICSLASVSSLAGYGSSDKGLINKLSEIKTSTVEESKPKSISLLQKALVIVFLLSISSAVTTIALTVIKDQSFFTSLEEINNANIKIINYQNLNIITRELVNIANGNESNSIPFINGNISSFLQQALLSQSESFREIQNNLEILEQNLMSDIFSNSLQDNITLKYLRSDGYYYTMNKSYELAFYEILTNTQELGQVTDFTMLQLDRSVLNDQGPWYLQETLTEIQRQVYFLLINMNDPALSFFPTRLANAFITNSNNSVNQNLVVFLIIAVITIAITMLTAILIIPIILRIESNKEKVFFIYAELSKNDVDDRKRNIRIFFAKLRQSTNNPGGSLFYQKSSRIVSSRLLTKKFSMKDESNQLGTLGLTRQTAVKEGATSKVSGERNHGDMEEDMRAELMRQQEELEAQVFKKYFHKKIKKMSCIKKTKYIIMILFLAGLVQGYFLMNYFLIADIDKSIQSSLQYYQIIAQRDPLLSEMISFYRESLARNETIYMMPSQIDQSSNKTKVSSIDYFLDQNLNNEKLYNSLRQSLPAILQGSSSIINTIEGNNICSIFASNQSICENAENGIMKTGITQIINTMVKDIVQDQIQFATQRQTEFGLDALINDESIRSIIYLKLIFLDNALETLIQSTTDSIKAYFKSMETNIVIAFAVFVVIMVVGVIISTTWGMAFLYRHFNATKSILNLIPGKSLIELSEKTDLKKIQF